MATFSPIVGQAPGRVAAGRIAWIDMARGLCVFGVVLIHVCYFHVFPLVGDSAGRPLLRAWVTLNTTVLNEVRMPLLLFLSGWLASTKVRAGLASHRTRVAIVHNVHLFLVWTILYFLIDLVLAPGTTAVVSEAETVPELLVGLLFPQFGPLWFVYLLVVCLLVMSLAHRAPPVLVVLGMLAVGWITLAQTDDPAGLPRAVFFALGVYIGPHMRRIVESRLAVGAALAVAVAFAALTAVIPSPGDFPFSVIMCAGLTIVALAVVKRLEWLRPVRVPTSCVGRRTLGIYVMHWPLVGCLVVLGMHHPELFHGVFTQDVALIAYCLTAALAVTLICLVAEPLLKAVGLRILFDPPRWVRDRLGGRTS